MQTFESDLNEILLEGHDGYDWEPLETEQNYFSDGSDLDDEDEYFDDLNSDYPQETFYENYESHGDYDTYNEQERYDYSDGTFEYGNDIENILTPEEEVQLAYELINIANEEDMEEFLKSFWSKIANPAKKIFNRAKKVATSAGRRLLTTAGKSLIRNALPLVGNVVAPGLGGIAGSALGSILGGGGKRPSAASPVGGALGGLSGLLGAGNPLAGLLGGGNPLAALLGSGLGGNILGKLLGGEAEYSNLEEAKHDMAKRIVRTIAQSTAQVSNDPHAAHDALRAAIHRNIPPAIRPALINVPVVSGTGNGGQWVRQGNNIIILGV